MGRRGPRVWGVANRPSAASASVAGASESLADSLTRSVDKRTMAENSGGFAGAADTERARRLTEQREKDKSRFAAAKRAMVEETERRGLKAPSERFDSTFAPDDALTRAVTGLVSKADYGRIRREHFGEDAPAAAPAADDAAAAAERERQRAANKRKAERLAKRQKSQLSFGDDEDAEGGGGGEAAPA